MQPAVRPAGRPGRASSTTRRPATTTWADSDRKVERLSAGLAAIEGIAVVPPGGTFYVFPDVRQICNRLGMTSHGLALYLLEGADDAFGVACLGGECFGEAGRGFLRFSCAEPDERIDQALAFLPEALSWHDRVRAISRNSPRVHTGRSRTDGQIVRAEASNDRGRKPTTHLRRLDTEWAVA